MTVRELKLLIADMSDDAQVWARDRDAIALSMIDVVGHPTLTTETYCAMIGKSPKSWPRIYFRDSVKQVYGGESFEEDIGRKMPQGIIFCDND